MASSSSSSSSFCCSVLYCKGSVCSHFSSWYLNGVGQHNSDNCKLYALVDIINDYQQISLFSDSSMSDLVAIGQRIVFEGTGSILIYERNGSGISGSVSWDGTPIFYALVTLGCEIFPSSSSSSSMDSSSSSSLSDLSSSSSSSLCCANLFCDGVPCAHFSGWTLNGNTKNNTHDCTLFVGFDYVSSEQQVSLYKDASRTLSSLVAQGQGSGTIILVQRNYSGLSGSVTWDGTPIYSSSTAVLDCEFSSSSSTSSSNSSSMSSLSRSSLSSISSYSSSLSSYSSLSSTSTSLSTSSSSSSLDSSSSSSESVGNVSTSSSSSFGGWNKTKPLLLGMSAINASGTINRMAQTISLNGDTYGIGKVFCYFYGPYGIDNSFTIHLEAYTCNDSGEPLDLLGSQVLSGSSITGNGWYSFDLNISGVVPSNKYMSFVVWQENGDEDNYILWGYYYATTTTGTKALFKNNGYSWQYQAGAVRSLKLIGNFDAYDLTEFRMLTPPAEKQVSVQDLSGDEAVYDRTKLVAGSYQYASDRVVIDNPNLISSFVIDSSGSMGWNDRFSTRQQFVNEFISQLKQKYPSNVLFDVVKFGAQIANVNSITSGIGTAADINVDLTSPDRTTFSFVVSPANAFEGDIYSNNSYSFTVSDTITLGTTLTCLGGGSDVPTDTGTLTRVSGSGDLTIEYGSYAKATLLDNFVAYGFKNFEESHVCNLAKTTICGQNYEISLKNWQPLTSGGDISLALGNNGPQDSESVDFTSSNNLVIRRPISTPELLTSKLTSDADFGSTTVTVQDASIFSVGDVIDVVDKNLASLGHTISSISGLSLTVTPALVFNIKKWDSNGGIVQESNLSKSTRMLETMANIQFRDVLTTRGITFFLQTINGLSVEWDIAPFKEWYINNLYWLDETAILPVSVFDVDGNPFPDGTQVIMYVGGAPSDQPTTATQNIVKDSSIGSDKIYLNSTSGFKNGQNIDILNNLNDVQQVTIVEVGTDSNGNYLKVDPVLQYDFKVSDGSKIAISAVPQDEANAISKISETNLLSSALSLVDVTPIYTGRSLDPSLLRPYDITQVDPSMTYDQLNLDQEVIRNSISDTPTINGYSVLRILPITEDNSKSVSEKDAESARLIRASSDSTYTEQLEQNQGDVEDAANAVSDAFGSLTTTTTTLPLSHGSDYNIDNPVYLSGGMAESSMTTTAIDLTEKVFEGLNVPGVDGSQAQTLKVKQYSIYPAIVVQNQNSTAIAKQYLTPFQIYFTPPFNVYSDYVGEQVSYVVPEYCSTDPESDCSGILKGYKDTLVNGVYATGNGFTLNYVVTNRNTFPVSGQLKIRIYSNTIVDIAKVVEEGSAVSRQDLNATLPKTSEVVDGQTVVTQPLSEIDTWREAVENNPVGQVIQTSESGNNSFTQDVIDTYAPGGVLRGSNQQETAFAYYTNPLQWTKATQYGDIQETVINIVNGKASLFVPSADISALLMIQASVYFGNDDQFESIRSDIIPVANPIEISSISPFKILAQGSDVTYEIGNSVTWKGSPIADNVIVSYAPASTQSLPSVSKTDDGWAGGVKLGPHNTVTMTCPNDCEDCCYGMFEAVNITVAYLGYTRTVTRMVHWTGHETTSLDDKSDFYFYVAVDSNVTCWADGTSEAVLTVDLNDVENEIWIESAYPADGFNRQRLKGYQQGVQNLPSFIRISSYPLNSTLNQNAWTSDVLYAYVTGLNKNIGIEPPLSGDLPPWTPHPPWRNRVLIRSAYRYYEGSQENFVLGTGCVQYPYYEPSESGENVLVIPYPMITMVEPLGIKLSLESYNGEFIRNGIDSPNIVADVTWRGLPITNKFTKNKGKLDETVIDFPFPSVTFEAGACEKKNVASSCTIQSNPDVSLSSYSAVVSLSRTDTSEGHIHSCIVDSDGNGTTDSVIVLSGSSVADHVHTIANYIVASSGSPSHIHNLRSVAIVKLNPVTNANVNIAIGSSVQYDPTECGFRMMSDTLSIESKVINRTLQLTMNAQNGYTAGSTTDTSKGSNIVVSAMFSSYSVQDYPGHWVVIPAKPVSDGTRIIWNIECYSPSSSDQSNNLMVVSPNSVREYMYINVTATVYAEELEASVSKLIIINSGLQWLPSVAGLVFEPTNDSIYLSSALSKINSLGASQIHDAVKMAAQRLIQFQTDNSSWKSAKKAIFLLTDGDENTSEYSIQQAIDNVNFIDGKCEVPVIPVRLGYAYGSDDIILNKYVSDTCGSLYYMINSSDEDIVNIRNNIISDSSMGINDGYYTNTIDLGQDNLASSASIESILVPNGSRILFRVRYSSDSATWTSWTQWYDSSLTKDFALGLKSKGRYFQYQIHLYGNENFESPQLYAGLSLSYYAVQTFTVFFQPIDLNINTDEYLASIHITHKATIPATSSIKYGYTQFNSTDIADYGSVTRPWITPDRHTIILTRYNEMLLTKNYQKYTAINGGWPQGAQVEVYKVNKTYPIGELISPTAYAINNKNGDITFYNAQNQADQFVICIYFDPVFRIACNVVNYGPDPVIVDHIGVLYNITKRIPTTSYGTIIHTPISERI